MKIAILTGYDPQNTRSGSSWPNTITFIAQVLQRHCGEVSYIRLSCAKEELIGRIFHKGSRLLIKKNFLYGLSFLLAKKYAEVAKQRLKGQSFDILVASCGAPAIALLETIMPFGANFEAIPPREIGEERKKSDRCKLLFVGIDRQRKGGDIAFETRGDGYSSGTHCVWLYSSNHVMSSEDDSHSSLGQE